MVLLRMDQHVSKQLSVKNFRVSCYFCLYGLSWFLLLLYFLDPHSSSYGRSCVCTPPLFSRSNVPCRDAVSGVWHCLSHHMWQCQQSSTVLHWAVCVWVLLWRWSCEEWVCMCWGSSVSKLVTILAPIVSLNLSHCCFFLMLNPPLMIGLTICTPPLFYRSDMPCGDAVSGVWHCLSHHMW